MTVPNPATSYEVDALVAELDKHWARAGVGPMDRHEMAHDVAEDLLAAAQNGTDPRQLLSPDLATFARQVAEARDVALIRVEPARVVLGVLLGAGMMLALSWAAFPYVHTYLTDHVQLKQRYPVAGVAVAAAVLGLVLLGGALLGLRTALVGRPVGRATVRRAAVLLPSGFVGAGLVVVVITTLTGNRDSSSATVMDFLAAIWGCLGAAVYARRTTLLNVHDPRQ
jgi:hypothetical protein